jgi:hypothetical protein
VVVVPDPSILLPRYNRTSSTAAALGIFTAAIGRPPQFRDDAWVWTDVATPGSALSLSTAAYGRCMAEPLVRHGSALVVPDCVVSASAGG